MFCIYKSFFGVNIKKFDEITVYPTFDPYSVGFCGYSWTFEDFCGYLYHKKGYLPTFSHRQIDEFVIIFYFVQFFDISLRRDKKSEGHRMVSQTIEKVGRTCEKRYIYKNISPIDIQ